MIDKKKKQAKKIVKKKSYYEPVSRWVIHDRKTIKSAFRFVKRMANVKIIQDLDDCLNESKIIAKQINAAEIAKNRHFK